MRDHTKLRAFELADEVALLIYQVTAGFPKEEQRFRFLLTSLKVAHVTVRQIIFVSFILPSGHYVNCIIN